MDENNKDLTGDNTSATEQSTADSGTEKTVTMSRFEGLKQEAARYKKQLAELEKERAAITAAQKADEEQKAIKAQEFEKVLQSRTSELDALKKELEAERAASKRGSVERALMQAGASSEIVREGLLAKWSRENPEDISEWISEQSKKHPEAFAPDKVPIKTGSVGDVATGHNHSLEARLNSKDPEIRKAALKERFVSSLS